MQGRRATPSPPAAATAPLLGAHVEDEARPLPGQVTDEVLMAAFCSGHEASFDELFQRHAAAVQRTLRRLSNDHALALDLTQATFLSVIKARHRFIAGSHFRPWLFVIAVNAWRDHRRRHVREVVLDPALMTDKEAHVSTNDPYLKRQVQDALAQLPEDQRESVLLHHVEGFSFKEIADMLNLRESAVKVRAHRGYEKLRTLLQNTWVDHE